MKPRVSWYSIFHLVLMVALLAMAPFFAFSVKGQSPKARSEAVPAYALLIGSNRPGPKQSPLRYTHEDALRVQQVLREVGGYSTENVTLLKDPTSNQITEALQKINQRIAEHDAKEEQTSFLFYYSGHARSKGLNLGPEELPLNKLRSELDGIPATIKIVLLDACQAGAYSRVKGATAAANFSINSVAMLHTKGTAVIASSGESELSQESDSLEGSFFTHHLVVGLRGAADKNGDGRVTLFEAYGYAYNQTLLATAETRVGKQHVTLETDLTGKGEMVLTWPAEANSKLSLTKALEGEVLIYQEKNRVVLAEVQKAAGSDLTLAFPSDEYVVLLKRGEQVDRCPVSLRKNARTELQLSTCVPIEAGNTLVKFTSLSDGQDGLEPEKDDDPFEWRFFIEGFFGGQLQFGDAYIDRLKQFGYEQQAEEGSWTYYSAVLGVHINRYFSFGLLYSVLDRQRWKTNERDGFESQIFDVRAAINDYEITWDAYRISSFFRVSWPLLHQQLIPYVQFGAGLAIGNIEMDEDILDLFGTAGWYGESGDYGRERQYGYALSIGLGMNYMFYESLGIALQVDYIHAPAIENYFNEDHESGGFALVGGCRFTL